MEWIKTTLRKGTKTPKICRDMFVTDSRGRYEFCQVKNGRIAIRQNLSKDAAKTMIRKFRLVKMETPFAGCFTYRDSESARLIDKILNR